MVDSFVDIASTDQPSKAKGRSLGQLERELLAQRLARPEPCGLCASKRVQSTESRAGHAGCGILAMRARI